jgi:hypothetical protein
MTKALIKGYETVNRRFNRVKRGEFKKKPLTSGEGLFE